MAGNALSTANLPETLAGVSIDTTTPSVSSVAATAGDYDAGKALTLTLNMSEAVNVTGTPTLTLNDGGTASYTGGTGTNALTFSYTVGAGQNTAGLAVTGITGTIADLAGNALSTANLPETFAGVSIDTTTPSVSSVAATAGDYDAGKALTLTLNMSEAVNVTGTPTLTLNDGGTASYTGGTGTSALTFSYTVGAGQNTAGLAVTGITGTIADLAGNALSTANLPETFAGVSIDTTTPSVSSVAATAGDYDAGKALTLTLNMSEAVNVTGTPTLTLNDGGTASYTGGTGTNALTFSYTVGAGQNTAGASGDGAHRHDRKLGRQCAEHRQPAGDLQRRHRGHRHPGRVERGGHRGRLRCRQGADPDAPHERGGQRHRRPDADPQRRRQRHLCFGHGHEHADLQLHGGGGPEHRRASGDGDHRHDRGPGRQRAEHRQPAGDLQRRHRRHHHPGRVERGGHRAAIYDAGKALTLTLNMSEAVNVTGTPTLTLNDGGSATYASGTGTNTLTFSYTVGAGQNTAGLAVTGITGTIADLAGNALSTANLPETFSGVIVDTATPVVSSVAATAGDYDAGKALTLTLHMSEAVNVTGTPTLTLNDGGSATYASRHGHEHADLQLHGGSGPEHRRASGDGDHRHDRGPGRQCAEHRQPAGDLCGRHHRHHDAFGVVCVCDRG